MERKTEQYDTVIIGGGAAGLTAVICCGRARLRTLVIEKALVGGLTTYTNEIENYPGFPEGNTGLDLMKLFRKQAKKFGIEFKLIDACVVRLEGDTRVVETSRTGYECHSVITISDGKPRLTEAPSEDKFLYDKGISFCATCDVAANTGEIVMVIGSGNVATEEDMFLTKFISKAIVSVIRGEGKMDYNEITGEETPANPKMEFIWDTLPEESRGDEERLHNVALKSLKTSGIIDVPVDTCFLSIGYVPNTEVFRDIVDMNRSSYMLTNEKMKTNMPGIFVAGDMRDKFLKQVATVAGNGAIIGYTIERYLAESEIFESQIIDPSLPGLVHIWNAVGTASRGPLPVIERFEQEHGQSVKVTKVDIYKSAGITNRLGITTTPNIAFIKGGKFTRVLTGDITKETLKAVL